MRYRDKAVHARNPEVLVAGRRRLAIVAAVVLVVLLAVGGWFLTRCLRSSQSQAGQGATTQMNVAKQKKHVVKKGRAKGTSRQFAGLSGYRLHRHDGQWRSAVPPWSVGQLRRSQYRGDGRYGL